MNRRQIWRAPLTASALAGLLGCGTYYSMREATQELEHARQDYVLNNPGNRYNEDITVGRVRAGMSRLQVRVAWGDPDRVNMSTRPGSGEEWAYDETQESSGTAIYKLHFNGEVLSSVKVERAGVQLPTAINESREKPTRAETLGDPGKKPR